MTGDGQVALASLGRTSSPTKLCLALKEKRTDYMLEEFCRKFRNNRQYKSDTVC